MLLTKMLSFVLGYEVDFTSPQFQLSAFSLSFVILISVYHLLAGPSKTFTTGKQVSWVITTHAGLVMNAASLPFVWDYLAGRGDVMGVRAFPELAVTANRFFQAYLLADLSMGAVYYRTQLNLLTGWIHHLLYIGIVEYAIRQNWAHVFCFAACMEFPTFILGISTLFPRLRSNVFFAVSFFLTRILFHIVICIAFYLPKNRPLRPTTSTAAAGSVAPAVILTCVFPLHASWFLGCLKGFKKRATLRREAEAKTKVVPVISLEIYSVPSKTNSSTYKPPAKFSANLDAQPITRRSLPMARAYIYDRYAHYSTRYAHYSTRYAHYRARLRRLGLRGKEHFERLSNSSLRPTLQRLPSLEDLTSLPSNLPSPTFEMPALRFDQITETLSTSLPTREVMYERLGLGKRRHDINAH